MGRNDVKKLLTTYRPVQPKTSAIDAVPIEIATLPPEADTTPAEQLALSCPESPAQPFVPNLHPLDQWRQSTEALIKLSSPEQLYRLQQAFQQLLPLTGATSFGLPGPEHQNLV